jgi:hypothetical protein
LGGQGNLRQSLGLPLWILQNHSRSYLPLLAWKEEGRLWWYEGWHHSQCSWC